jgi:hypothetical protein
MGAAVFIKKKGQSIYVWTTQIEVYISVPLGYDVV